MIVHIGWDACVEADEVVAILSDKSASPDTEALLNNMKETGRFTGCPEGEKSYLLLADEKSARVVASAIRSLTLQQRFLHNGLSG